MYKTVVYKKTKSDFERSIVLVFAPKLSGISSCVCVCVCVCVSQRGAAGSEGSEIQGRLGDCRLGPAAAGHSDTYQHET